MPKIANNPDDFIPGDATRVNQLEVNYRWLIARMDEIHAALCPDKNGTWQERARQAAEAAVKVQADIDRLRSENARLKADAEGYKNGQLQLQDACGTLFDANMKHGAWRKEAEVKIDKLRAENARLRVLLDTALDEHIESRGACPDDCWCWAAEKLLEETK